MRGYSSLTMQQQLQPLQEEKSTHTVQAHSLISACLSYLEKQTSNYWLIKHFPAICIKKKGIPLTKLADVTCNVINFG